MATTAAGIWMDDGIVPWAPLPYPDGTIAPVLQASIERHQAHLARLVHNLRSAGMSAEQIEANVTVLVDSYRRELLIAIRALTLEKPGPVGYP